MSYDRVMPKFERECVGEVSYGPSHKIICSVVHYRNHKNQLKWYGDLRLYTYSAKKFKFYASPKGITFTQEIALKLNNVVAAMTEENPTAPELNQSMIDRFQRYPNLWVGIGLVKLDGNVKIDIREWIEVERTGYAGYTTKGIRFPYVLRHDLSNMLLTCYNKMYDLGQSVINKTLDKKE